jgi:hypothetical protein
VGDPGRGSASYALGTNGSRPDAPGRRVPRLRDGLAPIGPVLRPLRRAAHRMRHGSGRRAPASGPPVHGAVRDRPRRGDRARRARCWSCRGSRSATWTERRRRDGRGHRRRGAVLLPQATAVPPPPAVRPSRRRRPSGRRRLQRQRRSRRLRAVERRPRRRRTPQRRHRGLDDRGRRAGRSGPDLLRQRRPADLAPHGDGPTPVPRPRRADPADHRRRGDGLRGRRDGPRHRRLRGSSPDDRSVRTVAAGRRRRGDRGALGHRLLGVAGPRPGERARLGHGQRALPDHADLPAPGPAGPPVQQHRGGELGTHRARPGREPAPGRLVHARRRGGHR